MRKEKKSNQIFPVCLIAHKNDELLPRKSWCAQTPLTLTHLCVYSKIIPKQTSSTCTCPDCNSHISSNFLVYQFWPIPANTIIPLTPDSWTFHKQVTLIF
jgi:hypothetical protein